MAASDDLSSAERKAPDINHFEAANGDAEKTGVVEVLHTDGTVDLVDVEVIGGEYEGMPPGYFRSKEFLGTVIVS